LTSADPLLTFALPYPGTLATDLVHNAFETETLKLEIMKTKIFLLAIAIMTGSFAFAQEVKHESETDADKKVLKKIKKQMFALDLEDYLEEGERQAVIITCAVNEEDEVEVVKISGYDKELNAAIAEILDRKPVRYVGTDEGDNFTFKMVLENRPA
jgi:hypothetical protein